MTDAVDLAVVGAGPAGLAAAAAAAAAGARVALIDEQPAAGGQIYRALGRSPDRLANLLGPDYRAGRRLLDGIGHPNIRHLAEATVWEVTPERSIHLSRAGRASRISAREIVLATGALERPMPFPGWTLPGVMTAGAGQILLKTAGLVPAGGVVLAGSGPLLLLLAWQYLRAGVRPTAVLETTPPGRLRAALPDLPGMLWAPAALGKGLALLAALRRQRVPHFRAVEDLEAAGGDRLDAIRFRAVGAVHELPCRLLLVHQGVVPNVQISRSLGLAHVWDGAQRCWRPSLNGEGGSTIAGIAIAGDGGGIVGAVGAAAEGQVAGLAAAARLGLIPPDEAERRSGRARRTVRRQGRARPFLDRLYAPAAAYLNPDDDVMVCRCEEVTAGQIRHYVDLGCLGPDQTKAFGRPGMGPCQGRYCGLTVAEIIAARRGVAIDEVGYYRIRSPIKPVTLGEVATLESADG